MSHLRRAGAAVAPSFAGEGDDEAGLWRRRAHGSPMRARGPECVFGSGCAACADRSIITGEESGVLSGQHEKLGRAVLSACALIYPLKWQNVLVPLLPASMLDAIHTPFPAVMGLRLEQLMAQGRALPDGVVWVHLDHGGAELSHIPRATKYLKDGLKSHPEKFGSQPSSGFAEVGAVEAERAREGAGVDKELQLVFCVAIASLLRESDAAMPELNSSGWRRDASIESAIEHALLDDNLACAKSDRKLPAELAPFANIQKAARRALFSPDALLAGTAWLGVTNVTHAGSQSDGPGHAGALQKFIVAAEQPANSAFFHRLQPRPPAKLPKEEVPEGEGEAAEVGTRFPLDLTRTPALQLTLPPPSALATVAVGADGAPLDEAESGPLNSTAEFSTKMLPDFKLPGGLRLPADLPLRAGAVRDELVIDSLRYAEDADYRAEVQRAQGRAGAAAAALAVSGAAAAGALLCSVQ
eukprot:CAMPEP_0179919404 /NCGR_PEP_ID=MMETSP0983-20121128/3898_1 /TAXON_ID=483367 /ORGANISM="non described non described, Strain CCMP 2436" /LENGTH=469 /DNA_ID=CAMNT_0021822303 /DNA_START=3123 /DNA_END=4536 /DNA_ORIENTATION=+